MCVSAYAERPRLKNLFAQVSLFTPGFLWQNMHAAAQERVYVCVFSYSRLPARPKLPHKTTHSHQTYEGIFQVIFYGPCLRRVADYHTR